MGLKSQKTDSRSFLNNLSGVLSFKLPFVSTYYVVGTMLIYST